MTKFSTGLQLFDAITKPFAIVSESVSGEIDSETPPECQILTVQSLNKDINRSIFTANGEGVVQYRIGEGKNIHQRPATPEEVEAAEAEGAAIVSTVKSARRKISKRFEKMMTKSLDAIRAAFSIRDEESKISDEELTVVAVKDPSPATETAPVAGAVSESAGTDSSDVVVAKEADKETAEVVQKSS